MSSHNIDKQLFRAEEAADPGASGTITVDRSPHKVGLVSAGVETRTLARPTRTGGRAFLYMKTDGGDITLTVTGGLNEDGDTTFVFSDPGQFIELVGAYESAGGTYYWRKVSDHTLGNMDPADLAVLESFSALTATVAELNRATDVSTRVVGLAVDTAITEALHEGRTILMTGAGAARTFTLPAATGGGGRYRFVVGQVNTSNYIINAVVGTDLFEGIIIGASTTDSATDAARTWLSGATDDSILLNGTTTGGVAIGDWVELEDLSATGWFVRGMVTQSGAEATPFRDAVA